MEIEGRRPLKSRSTAWAGRLSGALVSAGITPNQISQASIAFAAVAGGLFWMAGDTGAVVRFLLLIVAAAFVQLRLLANLMDGMVAIEGGRGDASGAFWNEMPDRIADLLILAGAGAAAGSPALGWALGGLAVTTAYLRAFGQALGMAPDYSGPMAKPHRMAAVTGGAVLTAFAPLAGFGTGVMWWVLVLVGIGTIATVVRRSMRIIAHLEDRGPAPEA